MTIADIDATTWSAWGVWATVAVYLVIGYFVYRQAKEAKELREAEMRPYVVVDFEVFEHRPIIFLKISNMGRTLARNVRFHFDPPLRSSLGQPNPNMVYMRHPEVEATSGATTREALDKVWRDKGWEEAPPPVVEDALADVRLLTEGMPSLAPGKTIPLVFDSIFSRDGKDYPDAYRVTVAYEGIGGRRYEEQILLDLGVYRNIQCIDTHGLTDIYKQVKRVADTVKSWTSGGRLKILSRGDEEQGRRLAG